MIYEQAKLTIGVNVSSSLLFLLAFLVASVCAADEMPFVTEDVDEIVILQIGEQTWRRAIFFRHGQVLGTRQVDDSTTWGTDSDGYFRMCWDSWICRREVRCKMMLWSHFDENPLPYQSGPWWCQFRNMRDLKGVPQ